MRAGRERHAANLTETPGPMRRLSHLLIAAVTLGLAGSAQAAVKFYSSDLANGTPTDQKRISINICPPIVITPDSLGGYRKILDDGLGTVTLDEYVSTSANLTDLTADILTPVFGPGAFIFIDNVSTNSITGSSVSNTSGIGAHGPSSTAPGQTAEWGIVSGFGLTGTQYCVSSPVAICNENGFAHGATITPVNPSTTYDLGTWNFDAVGDLQAESYYLTRTSNGGLSNNHVLVEGALMGASLPALPLIGFGALALGLAVLGGRALLGKK
jgi:hypothetical protein